MGTTERREREKRALRGRILDAARELFAAEGYEAVTMRSLAARIEYTPAALYFHFKDKESLLRELCTTDFLALAGSFGAIGRIADPVERLARIGRAYVEFGLSKPNQYRLMFMTPHPAIEPDDTIRKGNPEEDAWALLRATVAEAIAAGRFRPELRDPDLAAQVLWAAVHGVVSLHIAKASDPWVDWKPPRKTAETAIDGLLRGILRDDDRGRKAPAPRRRGKR